MSTNVLSAKDIKRDWHLIDAKDKVLGRLATEVATKLMGKNQLKLSSSEDKASFVPKHWVPYLDTGDYVVVINASLVRVTGKKSSQKKYFRHSGYPGGDRVEIFSDFLKKRPTEVIRHAILGMLPKSNLGKKMIKKLYIYKDKNHPFEKQLGAKK